MSRPAPLHILTLVIGLARAACADDPEPAQTGTPQVDPEIESGVDGEKTAGELTAAEADAICGAVGELAARAKTTRVTCDVAAAAVGAFAATAARETCEAAVEVCEREEAPLGVGYTCRINEIIAECPSVTVFEIETCFWASLEARAVVINKLLAELQGLEAVACDGLPESTFDALEPQGNPVECASIERACPQLEGAFDPTRRQ